MSHVWGRDVINPAGDVICRECDVMNAVIVMAYSCCQVVYKGYDVVIIVDVISEIKFV